MAANEIFPPGFAYIVLFRFEAKYEVDLKVNLDINPDRSLSLGGGSVPPTVDSLFPPCMLCYLKLTELKQLLRK